YASQTDNLAARWLRANPHRLHLGRIGFQLKKKDGSQVNLEDLTNITQTLDLWTGTLKSSYQVEGQPVNVITCCHPNRDIVAVRVESPLLKQGRLAVTFHFPYGTEDWGPSMADWNNPQRHKTIVVHSETNRVELQRQLDVDRHYVYVAFSGKGRLSEIAPHQYILVPGGDSVFEFLCEFAPEPVTDPLPSLSQAQSACRQHWRLFWSHGGAIDFSESEDPRAHELERRIVLSQYLTAIQCAGSLPPQESGLTHNSWYGKFHLEMHWWHAVHFALWNRIHLLQKSLSWYQSILPMAQATASMQGYDGARWPKMIGPDGREGPSHIGVFLIWQQPHPIYYAELCYRNHPARETLEKYRDIVFQTADFMASYAVWEKKNKRYVLGPPLIAAQECYEPEKTWNPTFELAYWAFGLDTARQWRRRLGLPPNRKWDHVREHLSPLPVTDGLYVTTEATPDTFTNPALRRDHPSHVAALGLLPPTDLTEPQTMCRTLRRVFQDWDWQTTWGWDYPMLAMTAARLGEPRLAIEALLMDTPKNRYLPNGHCYQRTNLPVYLPANGGLLTAAAMMAAGWDGATDKNAPGFPKDGNWTVRSEGLTPMP
ncbi:MAG: glycoside hydrolase family 65, partial [Planctomycetota bacterium]